MRRRARQRENAEAVQQPRRAAPQPRRRFFAGRPKFPEPRQPREPMQHHEEEWRDEEERDRDYAVAPPSPEGAVGEEKNVNERDVGEDDACR